MRKEKEDWKRERLEEEQLQLDKLRAKYAARRQQLQMKGEHDALRSIKRELQDILSDPDQVAPIGSSPRNASPSGVSGGGKGTVSPEAASDEALRLEIQKGELLASGLYTEQDPLVMQLTRKIAQLRDAGENIPLN